MLFFFNLMNSLDTVNLHYKLIKQKNMIIQNDIDKEDKFFINFILKSFTSNLSEIYNFKKLKEFCKINLHVYISCSKKEILILFRESFCDRCFDTVVEFSKNNSEGTLYLKNAIETINKITNLYGGYKLLLSGHSLGGSIAIKISEYLYNNNFTNFKCVVFNPFDFFSFTNSNSVSAMAFLLNNFEEDDNIQKEYIKKNLYNYKFNPGHNNIKYYSYLGDISSFTGSYFYPWVKIIKKENDENFSLLSRHNNIY